MKRLLLGVSTLGALILLSACDCGGDSCRSATCEELGWECGEPSDGCGGTLQCGECDAPETCGPDGICRFGCHPATCDEIGDYCGPMPDGCGGFVECVVCEPPETCGGGGEPSRCGVECDELCLNQVDCPGDQSTTLTGTVRAPNGVEPIYNAVVYVPNAREAHELPPIEDGVVCERCEDQYWGRILAAAVTGPDGTFELRNVPAAADFLLVIQVGKWQRVVRIPAVAPCSTTSLTAEQTRLPRNQNEGHIPRFAISTGAVDGLECVLLKGGVDEQEFTRPDGNGRIHLYRANGAWPDQSLLQACSNSCTDRNTGACSSTCRGVISDNLYTSLSRLNEYDVVVFGCEASKQVRSQPNRNNILQYVNGGGRLFLSHWGFDWVYNYYDQPDGSQSQVRYQTDPLHTTCNWQDGHGAGGFDMDPICPAPPCLTQAYVDSSFERGAAFSEWLDLVGASNPVSGELTIHEPRGHCRNATGEGRGWIHTTMAAHGTESVQQLTFNTPVDAPEDEMCGRVVYSAFHVTTGWTDTSAFPSHCQGPMTAQEKVLLYMLFDLATCVSDDDEGISACNRRTCSYFNAECGTFPDGCGGLLECGECPEGEWCVPTDDGYRCWQPG